MAISSEHGMDVPLALADARYVLEWLRQTNAPVNIIGLMERVVRILGGTHEG